MNKKQVFKKLKTWGEALDSLAEEFDIGGYQIINYTDVWWIGDENALNYDWDKPEETEKEENWSPYNDPDLQYGVDHVHNFERHDNGFVTLLAYNNGDKFWMILDEDKELHGE